MKLKRLDCYRVDVPLRKPIKHASHERSVSENFVIKATLNDGTVGWGEGVPRPYVTGETIETAAEAVGAVDLGALIGSLGTFEEATTAIGRFTLPTIEADPRGMFGNAARSAAELALLDACGRHFGRSVGDAVRAALAGRSYLRPSPGPVRYSGAITAETPRKERIGAWKMRLYGFAQVKIKVGVPGQDDPARLRRMRRILGRSIDVRLDANEAWSGDVLLERVAPLRSASPTAIEQPVPHAEVGRLAELRPALGLPVMLDESLCGEPDGRRAVREGLADLFNVRVSKCGGLFPTLRLIGLAYEHGLGVQLGCHPGETSLLSAAGRHLAANVAGLRYVEGSYDRHVLAENLTTADLTFGYGGRAGPIGGPGLGVEVDPERLERLGTLLREITYE